MISAGSAFTVGLKADGSVIAAGRNISGKLDAKDWKDMVQVFAGGSHTVGVKRDGTVLAVGKDYRGQLEVGSWTTKPGILAMLNRKMGLIAFFRRLV